ncbi:hypothetical protein [uncultured Fibrobacter sp.]|uniref:hypothetical protein n=1 Tax=uncultured Fibrobacter sp. TaxID=261512 RepID=UPI0025D91622|nr:hypothetical protein [uncultured Fibrobacter sp.]
MFGRLSFTAFLVACVTALLFSGCAWFKPPVESDRTAAVSEPARDSLRAKFVLTVLDSLGKEQDLDAVLFSVPHKRYRMELTGPMGVGVASLLWTEEGWNMVFPTEKKYLSGVGYMVGLMGDNSVPMVPIHQMADIFEGVLVPERSEVLAESDSAGFHVVKVRAPSGMQFTYGKRDGEIAWLMRGGRDGKPEILKFSEFKEFEGVRLPSNVEFEAGGKMFLKIRIKKVARNKAFSLGTWRLNVPKSYKRIGE